MRKPQKINNLSEIRKKIDSIDKKIVDLLAQRYAQIKIVSTVKKNLKLVRDNKRIKEIMSSRNKWAKKSGIPAKTVRAIFQTLLESSIEEQIKLLKTAKKRQK
jgi:chorismate mutase